MSTIAARWLSWIIVLMPIALVTDFGTEDYYVGAMKGVILSIDPRAVIVDITHDIKPQKISTAAFILAACYRDFPRGTIFVCVVDPGVGSARRRIMVESESRIFVGPDNGVFGFTLNDGSTITSIENEKYFSHPVSNTFHGRDIFAPVAAHLSLGVKPGEIGSKITDPVILPNESSKRIDEYTVNGRVIHIDRFGNIVTNVTSELWSDTVELIVSGHSIIERREFYAGAEPGKLFAVPGSAGFIEISINGGSAAKFLAVEIGSTVMVKLA